jgi:hypothetical protein
MNYPRRRRWGTISSVRPTRTGALGGRRHTSSGGSVLTVLLCLSLAIPVSVVPTSAVAGPAQGDSARVRVIMDTEALGDAEAPFKGAANERLREALEAAGYELDDSVRANATVRVRISYFNKADLDYQIDVDLAVGEQILQLGTLGCPSCVEDDLLAAIDGRHAEIVAALERALAQQTKPQPVGDVDPPAAPTTKTKPIGALGGVGIGVSVLGVGMLVAGGVELGRGRIYDDVTQSVTERTGIDHRPVGGAMLGVGAVMLTAGVTMLVVDLVRSKKQRQAGLVHPLLGPSIVGLGYAGRF